jgi:hypothetical protein
MTKTSQFMSLLYHLVTASGHRVSEKKLRQLLNNPSKSTWYRLIHELTHESIDVPALLIEMTDPTTSEKSFRINANNWQAFISSHEEGNFLLHCYRQLGHLIPSDFIYMDFTKLKANTNRKFFYLKRIHELHSVECQNTLNMILEALINEKQMEIFYDTGIRILKPLTLCQYLDSLYLMCYRKKENEIWENRTYKLSRMKHARVLEFSFSYPSISSWNPEKDYAQASGLKLGVSKTVQIKVFSVSRKKLSENNFFNNRLVERHKDFDIYICTYTHSDEFLMQIFAYVQDIQILDDEDLRQKLLIKIESILKRNQIPLPLP